MYRVISQVLFAALPVALLVPWWSTALAAEKLAAEKPNVVLVITDDK